MTKITNKIKKVDFDTAVEYTEYGKFNIALTVISGLCFFGVNAEMFSVSYILPSAECDLNLDTYLKGLLTGISFSGILSSTFMWGYISDTKGRKKLIIGCLLGSFCCTVLSTFAPTFWSFTFFRFLNGVFICGPGSIVFAYFGEFHSNKNRSRSMAWASLFIGLALTALPGFAWLLLRQNFAFQFWYLTFRPWRAFMLACGLPSVIVILGLSWFPESPKLLFHNGKKEECLMVLKTMYAINTGKPKYKFPVDDLDEQNLESRQKGSNIFLEMWKQSSPLLRKPYLAYTLLICLTQFGNFATSSGLFLWYPDILNQLSNSNGVGKTVCQAISGSSEMKNSSIEHCVSEVDSHVFQQNLLVGAVYLAGYSVWGIVVNLLGNRMLLVILLTVSAAGTAALCLVTSGILIDILFIIVLVLPGICTAVVNAAIVDTFSTNLCGMAICLSMMFGRVGSILSSSFVGILLEFNCNFTFILYAISTLICAILSFFYPKKPIS